jgi:hypothetical protein
MKKENIIIIFGCILLALALIYCIYSILISKEWSWELEGDNDNVISFTTEQIRACDSNNPASVFRSILDQDVELFVFETRYDNDFDNITS